VRGALRPTGLICLICLTCLIGQAAEPPAGRESAEPPAGRRSAEPQAEGEITPSNVKAIKKGLAFLARMQSRDGSWAYGSYGGGRSAAITGICGLAFMAQGHVPGRGKYAKNVEKALDWMLKCGDRTGILAGRNVSHGCMYGHGFATLFLAEAYGMNNDPVLGKRIKKKLQKAVRLICQVQLDSGGWWYQPSKMPGRTSDLSVTICQTMALRAARATGINVPQKTIDKAMDCVKRAANSDGGFSYQVPVRGKARGGSAFPRSAAGVCILYGLGQYKAKETEKGVKYLLRSMKRSSRFTGHYFYGNYYATQAMYQAGGSYWAKWWPSSSRSRRPTAPGGAATARAWPA